MGLHLAPGPAPVHQQGGGIPPTLSFFTSGHWIDVCRSLALPIITGQGIQDRTGAKLVDGFFDLLSFGSEGAAIGGPASVPVQEFNLQGLCGLRGVGVVDLCYIIPYAECYSSRSEVGRTAEGPVDAIYEHCQAQPR